MLIILFLFLFESHSFGQLLNTTSGIYLGRTVDYRNITVQQYLGIEYGRIQKRFERAEFIRRDDNNQSILNATSFGPICKPTRSLCTDGTTSCSIKYGIFSLNSSADEQCLFLNVFIPMINQEKKAIFMWIHGGSSQVGTGNVFDGTILAALGNIIVVTFNFRLNLFGFLSSGDQRLEGNLGLYDQSMVLDWIYENIEALGGDNQRITVGGHSAGAPHAYYLAKSPFNRGRIRRLILQSGCPFNIWSHIKPEQAIDRFNVVAHDNQCGMMETFEEKLECLRKKEYHLLIEHEHPAYTSANHTNVVIHGEFMKKYQDELNVEILMGSNDDEGVYVAIVPIMIEQHHQESLTLDNVNFTDISLKFLMAMQPDKSCLYQKALELYHINTVPDQCSQSSDCYCSLFYNYSRLISDILFYNDYYRFLTQHIQSSNRTYLYRYSYRTSQQHPTSCNDYLHKHDLVGHFAELEYTWGTPLINYIFNTTEQIEFSREMIKQWSNFIKHGQPDLTDQWSPISDGYLMHLKLPRNELKKFTIPSNIEFWMNQCTVNEISWIEFFYTSLIDLFLPFFLSLVKI